MENEWNLILFACRKCNEIKSNLEDDISAITMLPDRYGRRVSTDERLKRDRNKKAKDSFSRRTGRPIEDSDEAIKFNQNFLPRMSVDFTFRSPPVIEPRRAFELARYMAMACFYFLTFDKIDGIGRFWPGCFMGVWAGPASDWGNELFLSFVDKTRGWDGRILINTACGHFRIRISKHPQKPLWSVATEWNASYRVIAAFGDKESLDWFYQELPRLNLEVIIERSNEKISWRQETPLAEADDEMFSS